jgi:hypothetical protein
MPITAMGPEQFRQFFTSVLADETFREELARDGLTAIERRVGPLDLPDDMRAAIVGRIPTLQGGRALADLVPACGACGVCGACAICGEINFGAGVIALSALVAIG